VGLFSSPDVLHLAVRATEGAKEIGVGSHSRVIIDVASGDRRASLLGRLLGR
jgi:hypothetical protein